MVTVVNAAPTASTVKTKRAVMVEMYAQQKRQAEMNEKFLEAVKKGDVETIGQLETQANNPSYLMATDGFGNNAFHLAKDVYTVQAVARSLRNLYKDEFSAKILTLKNQPNNSGVIPAVQAVFDLHPANFSILLDGSNLERDIAEVKSLSKGGALAVAVSAKQPKVVAQVQLAEGFTAAKFARDNQNVEGMDEVVAFFAENAPYL